MMFAFLAPAALKLFFGGALSKAAHGVSAVGGWLSHQKPVTLLCMGLGVALLVQHIVDHRHAAKLTSQLTKSTKALTDTRAAFAQTVANYRGAAAKAEAEDKANADRVRAEQSKINQETSDAFETRLAAARATAERMRHDAQAAAYLGGGGTAPVPGVRSPAGGTSQAAGEDGFSLDDRLTATEQAIQLDELIKWVKRQAGIDVNGTVKRPPVAAPH